LPNSIPSAQLYFSKASHFANAKVSGWAILRQEVSVIKRSILYYLVSFFFPKSRQSQDKSVSQDNSLNVLFSIHPG
jgi:hypothetical protein